MIDMSYEINSRLPRLRMEAVRMVRAGQGVREIARHFGYTPGAVSKWVDKAKSLPTNSRTIPTISSRPHHHPKELPQEIVNRVLEIREEKSHFVKLVNIKDNIKF